MGPMEPWEGLPCSYLCLHVAELEDNRKPSTTPPQLNQPDLGLSLDTPGQGEPVWQRQCTAG